MEATKHTGYLDEAGVSRMLTDLKQRTETKSQEDGVRDMLRTALAAKRQISVAVVGAGLAGLKCADVLINHGAKVTIFEARDRIGGRVAQERVAGHLVDLGPNWIHGAADNPIMDLAKETGTQLHAWDDQGMLFDSNGAPLDLADAREFSSLLWEDGVIADAFRYSNMHHDSIDPQRSLYDFFVEKADGFFLDQPAEIAKTRRENFLKATWQWGAYVGVSIKKQSLKQFWLEECIEGENPFVAETYQKILSAVAKTAVEKADIRLNSQVAHFHSDDGSASTADSVSRPSVELADGSKHEFDEVVVTTPLGWLKRNKDAFKPSLPPRLDSAINNIGYGALDKIYISFSTAFWDTAYSTRPKHSHGLDPDGTTPNVTATTAPVHQPRTNGEEKAEHYPSVTQWLAPEYAPESNPSSWDFQGMNLAALPGAIAHPTILFYIYGDCSYHVASLVASCKGEKEKEEKLLAFMEPYFSRLPDYSADDPACKPSGAIATAWAGDEFAGYGSYANFQVGLEDGGKDVEVMRHGMPERGVWLAGEHTAPFIALGTSTGAYWSGEGVGKRIVEAYKLGNKL